MEAKSPGELPLGINEPQQTSQALPQVRGDLEITEQVYFGKSCYVLKDPTTLRYYRLRPPEYCIFQMLDGQREMDDVLKELAGRFPKDEFDRQAVMNFIIMLRGANLLQTSGQASSDYLLKRKAMMKKGIFKKIQQEFLFYRIPLLDPDKFLNWLDRNFGSIIFSRFMKYFAWLILFGAIFLVVGDIDKFSQRQPLLSWINLLYMFPVIVIVKAVHEIGHGLTSKHFGSEVHEMGILFLVFMPCAYCDVSDSWMIREKNLRMWITAAGIVIEIMLASLATYVWAITPGGTIVNQFALNLMIMASLNTLLFNGNPLLRYDGYYFLMDLMEIPNLKQKGSGYLWYLMQRYVLGVKDANEPIDVRGREPAVLGYGICSAFYRWFIMFAIVSMVWKILDPYGWGVVGAVMAIGCIYNALVTPLAKFFKFLLDSWDRIHFHKVTAAILLLLIGGGIYGILGIKIEQSVDAQCVLRPQNLHPLYVTRAGFIDPQKNQNLVQDGQVVRAGEVLLVLSDPELEVRVAQMAVELKQLNNARDRTLQAGMSEKAVELNSQIAGLTVLYQRAQANLDKLTIKAEGEGVVQLRTKMPMRNLVGSYLPVGTALMGVYQPNNFEAVAAINKRDFGKIEPDQPVKIKLWSMDSQEFESVVKEKPAEPVRKMSSAAFSTVYKGEVPTMPAADEQEALEPADVTYELELQIIDQQSQLRDGMVGRVKIIVQEKSLWQSFYLWLIQTIRQDIRL